MQHWRILSMWLCVVSLTTATRENQIELEDIMLLHDLPMPDPPTVPHRTSGDYTLDPCKAVAMKDGDIALFPDEYEQEKIWAAEAKAKAMAKQTKDTLNTEDVNRHIIKKSRPDRVKSSRKDRQGRKHLTKEERLRHKRERRLRRLRRQQRRRERHGKDSTESQSVSQSSHREKRAATARRERLWDYGIIPYEIEKNFSGSHKALFKQAMRHWENHTCITFVERQPEDYNYILFTERQCGCCSFVGKRGNGAQAISIGKNCDKFGIVVHELGHVVGFWHEHTRPDRDNHVLIHHENILANQDYNFNKLSSSEVDSLGEPYDFESIMHYARNTFSIGLYFDTISPRKDVIGTARPEIGQRIKLSDGDISQANRLYKCPSCGRTLQDSSGKFFSPELRKDSPAVAQPLLCQWRISATHGEKIVLNITFLDIIPSQDCRRDYLEIRDGHGLKSPLTGKYCGTDIPPTIVSSESRMWLEYRSSGQGNKGFSASYEAVCGGEIYKEEAFLSSPNYPDFYKSNKECVWKLIVPEGYSVALKFQSFEVENHDNCVYDYLEVRDGHEDDSRLIGKYCGYKLPEDIQSSTNKLYVKFVSDGSVQKAGFAASFMKEYDECATNDHGCHHKCVNTLGSFRCECNIGYELHSDGSRCEDACGGYIEAQNGTLQSPSYPDLYPANKNCVWQIVAKDQFRITINFTHFDLEGKNQDCDYDSLEVRSETKSGESILHGTFCGQEIPQPITSDGSVLKITFATDNTVQKTGFAAVFLADMDECSQENGGCHHQCKNTVGSYQCSCDNGYTLQENKHDCKEGGCKHEVSGAIGEINSPNWPEYYLSRKECVWHFVATPGHRVKLVFNEFLLEPHQECTYDHVAIYDGDNANAPLIGKYCGSKLPDPVLASSNRMFMTFYSDASVQRKGFHATHTSVCGGRLQAGSSVSKLFSHAKYGDQNYDNKEDCDWLIWAEGDFRVRFRFLAFEVESEADCGYDYVEVFDGKDSSMNKIGKFCGNTAPDEIVSTTRYLLIRFKTDDTINWKGFSAAYVLASPDSGPVTPSIGTTKFEGTVPYPHKPKHHKKYDKAIN